MLLVEKVEQNLLRNYTSDYIIACIDTFNAEVTHVSQVITLSHTLLHSTQK